MNSGNGGPAGGEAIPASAAALMGQITEADPGLIARAVADKPPGERQATASEVLTQIPPGEARKAVEGTLPSAPARIWYVIITGLFLLALVFGLMAYDLLRTGKDPSAIIALATGALGGVIGLLTPGPTARQ